MPANNDPVLSRPMFSNSLAPTVQPFQAHGTGITSNVVSPDEGAKQLISTFGGSGMAGMAGTGYADGGYVKHFKEGGYNLPNIGLRVGKNDQYYNEPAITAGDPTYRENIQADITRPEGYTFVNPYKDDVSDSTERRRLTSRVPDEYKSLQLSRLEEEQAAEARRALLERARAAGAKTGTTQFERSMDPTSSNMDDEAEARMQRARSGVGSLTSKISAAYERAGEEPPYEGVNYNEQMAGVDRTAPISSRTGDEEYGPPMPSPSEDSKKGEEQGPPMPPKGSASDREKRAGKGGLDLLLEDIKNRRAASAEEKENNKWMALMQAGLAIAGGRSPHALQNVGAGGLQGAQAYAASEKERRAEDRALFSEEAQVRLAQEKMAETADERAAQRELLTSRERERLHERALTREQQAHDRGIAALNTAAGQTRQELNDISNQLSRLDGEIRRYELTMATDPEVSKAAIARLNQEKQAYADRAAEVRSRQDELLGLQGRKVPERNQDFSGFRMLGGAPKQ